LSKDEISGYIKGLSIKRLIQLFLPLVVLITFLVRGYTVATAGVLSTVLAMLLYLFSDLRLNGWISRIKDLLLGLIDGGKGLVLIGLLGACADIIVGMLSLTGLGVELSAAIYSFSGGELFMGLLLGMVTTIFLGLGLPTTAAFILASAVVAPALSNFNVDPLAANLFLFYFACMSAFTPPVCVAIFITAGIAQANWVKSSFVACKLGAAAFLIPFLMMYHPELLLRGSIGMIAIQSAIACLGTIMLAGGIMGNFYYDIGKIARIFLIAGALMTLHPEYLSTLLGLAIGVGVFFIVKHANKAKNSFS